MLLTGPDIRFCLDKAAEISEIYRLNVLNGAANKKSVGELLRLCREYLNKNIAVHELRNIPAEGKSIRGYYLRFSDRYVINLLSGMNLCWRRFVLCKELFHVILDEERYRTTDIYGHIEEVVAKFPVPQPAGPAVVSEALAEIAAMEFMFPYDRRLIAIQAPEIDYLAVAQAYKIPQALVEEYLAESFVRSLGSYMGARA